ncbi:MAG: tetratricopeptide repeat protein [Deltaproteobacteria bacterium]|nr:MAG: tetratricopeptide repeat protein [Deltaproteobacteria bacterium]
MQSSPAHTTEPSAREFAAAVAYAERRGDVQAVIRLVEAWEREHRVALEPGLAQARAFLELRLMDRAWVRLRELSREHPDDPDVLALTAEVFVQRGWPARARKVLDRLQQVAPDHPDLAGLVERAGQPPAGPPSDARSIERQGDPAALVALAESYLATGSFLRARSILERVRRTGGQNRRVELLLWGLAGDFVPRGSTVADLLAELGGTGGWEIVDHTEVARAAELGQADPPTAEVTRSMLVEAGELDAPSEDRFPSLFRRVHVGAPVLDDEDEVTVASGMASAAELRDAPTEDLTDPGAGGTELDADTRIMQVIPGPGGPSLGRAEGPIHQEAEGVPGAGLKETLDLRAWQESMGMGATAGPDDEDDYLEEEDEDLVVLTRREEVADAAPAPPEPRQAPIEVIEKHPVPEPIAEVEPTAEEDEEEVARLRETTRPGRRLGRIIVAIAAMVLAMGGATFLSLRYLHTVVADRQLDEVERALAAGDYRGLLEQEARLSVLVDSGAEPLESRALALAWVEAVLWGEYTGNPAQHERARQSLELARAEGARPEDLALVEGTLALLEGDLRSAARSASVAGIDTEAGRYLAARVALARGDANAGLTLWQAGDAETAVGVRHRLLYEELLRASGDTAAAEAEARRLLAEAGDNPLVRVAAAIRGWGIEDRQAHLAAIDALLDEHREELSPRQLARLHGARARLLAEAGDGAGALDAWRRAASVDATWAPALAVLAATELEEGRVLDALATLQSCVEHNPADVPCLRGEVQALVELDRLAEAAALVAEAPVSGRVRTLLQSWIAVQDGRSAEALPQLASLVGDDGAAGDGLGAYLLGRAWADAGEPADKVLDVLGRARARLLESADPFDRLLVGRVDGAIIESSDPGEVARRARAALAERPRDPWLHVSIARRLEAMGRHRAAVDHMQQAVAAGPENAVAWYEMGQLQFSPRTMSEALGAWRQYLALAPSSARAARVRKRVE